MDPTPSLVLLALTLYSYYPGNLAILHVTNNTEKPSYEDMIKHMENITDEAYLGYPKRNNLTGSYPSPKGSKVIEHPGGIPVWTLETEVEIFVTVEGLSRLDVENQYLELVVEETFLWFDENLILEGTTDDDLIEIHKSKIWTPEILPDAAHAVKTLSESPSVRVNLKYGSCFQTRQKSYAIPCSVNVQPFPFDIHNCSLRLYQKQQYHTRMKFISIVRPEDRRHYDDPVKLITSRNAARSLSSDSGTLDWIIRDFNSTVVKRIRSNTDNFETDEYVLQLIINRRSVFYATVLIFPCMLLNLLSFVIFTLPLKDTERENFAVTLILTYFVLIMIVVDASPSSGSDIPLLGMYIILSMCIVLVDFIVSLVLIEIHEHCRERKTHMPNWLTTCLNSRCILWAFTHKRHFQDTNANNAKEELVETEGMIQKKPGKGKKKRSIKEAKEEYKWKVFLKVLNFIFFILSIIAHIALAVVMYCILPTM